MKAMVYAPTPFSTRYHLVKMSMLCQPVLSLGVQAGLLLVPPERPAPHVLLVLLALHVLPVPPVLQCGLDEGRLARWLVRLEAGYPPNPYHNRTHAADVTRNVHVLMTRGGLGAAATVGWGGADDIAQLAIYLAAVRCVQLLPWLGV